MEVDGIRLDPNNEEFMLALVLAQSTDKNLYITGKAGSGKTFFLKYLKSVCSKDLAVLAPTGVAAINAGGQTIHSFFGLAPSLYVPNDKRFSDYLKADDVEKASVLDHYTFSGEKAKIMKALDMIIIDEVSMVRADLMDAVDMILRMYRRNNLPFGGVQMVFIGDAFQIPPVVESKDSSLLYRFYESEHFFNSRVLRANPPLYLEFKKIYRQKDRTFIDLLNRVRVNDMRKEAYQLLNSRYQPGFLPDENDSYIVLATTNRRVMEYNNYRLSELPGEERVFVASADGDFSYRDSPADEELHLKPGAQVMFVKNNKDKGYFNGKLGKVADMDDSYISVEVETEDGNKRVISVAREVWKSVKYTWDDVEGCVVEETVGSFEQFPLRLAWAVTVHKSQGLTFEKVIADIGDSFASGQAYVALSRCSSFEGLVLLSPVTPTSIRTDPRVLAFAKSETPNDDVFEVLYDAEMNDLPSIHTVEVLVNVVLTEDEPAFPRAEIGYAYSLNKIPADLDAFLVLAISNRFYDEGSVEGFGSFTISHAASGKETTYYYPYPEPHELTTSSELFTYTSEPIPMRKILGDDYVFDKEKKDSITITVYHNMVRHYQVNHLICSIEEALGDK